MRKHIGRWFLLAGLATLVAWHSPLAAAEQKAKDGPADDAAAASADAATPPREEPTPKKKDRTAAANGIVAAAYALPKGVILNPKQQAAYDDLKQKSEPDLRQAFDDVHQAKGATETAKAIKEVRQCRAGIRAAIQEILAMPYETPQQASGNSSQGARSGGYVPQYTESTGYAPSYDYRSGYYPYAGNYYPYSYSSSGTANGGWRQSGSATGSTSSGGKYSLPNPSSHPTSKPVSKPAPAKH